MDHTVFCFIFHQLLICCLSDQLIVTSLSERTHISNRCVSSYPTEFTCLPLSLPWGFSWLQVKQSILFLPPFKWKPLQTANHFYCLYLHIVSSLRYGGRVHKILQRRAGKDVVELTLMKNLIGQWFQFKLQCHSWNNVRTHFTTYYKRKTTEQEKLITLWMLPWDPFTQTGSARYWMFSSHWAEIIWCFAGRVGLLGSLSPFLLL